MVSLAEKVEKSKAMKRHYFREAVETRHFDKIQNFAEGQEVKWRNQFWENMFFRYIAEK